MATQTVTRKELNVRLVLRDLTGPLVTTAPQTHGDIERQLVQKGKEALAALRTKVLESRKKVQERERTAAIARVEYDLD